MTGKKWFLVAVLVFAAAAVVADDHDIFALNDLFSFQLHHEHIVVFLLLLAAFIAATKWPGGG